MDEYWTEIEREALKEANSYEEAADIAIAILARMRDLGQPIVQICGPMSTGGLGSLRENMQRFQRAVDIAIAKGITVFNQVAFQEAIIRLSNYKEGSEEYGMDILERFYQRVFEAGYIDAFMFLPGWESSIGTRWEREVGSKLGIEVKEYPIEWLEEGLTHTPSGAPI
ncbi:MAG TPA: DUF4406 domain-containing protein [Candidatus Paceibacterota bacterium]|jgi:hypothetical protein